MNELIAAVTGAAIAGLIAWWVGAQQIRAARRDAHVHAVDQAVNDLWLAADQIWESTLAVADFADEIQAQRAASQTPLSPELHPMLRNAQAQKSEASARARHALARLRMLNALPELIDRAEVLAHQSGKAERQVDENAGARDAARKEFEAKVAARLG